jgi:hypothetical protein
MGLRYTGRVVEHVNHKVKKASLVLEVAFGHHV